MVGTTLFLLLTSAWAGTLRDNFDDGNFEGGRLHKFADKTAQWSVEKGELICISKNFLCWLFTSVPAQNDGNESQLV